jgi:hypothetical protein
MTNQPSPLRYESATPPPDEQIVLWRLRGAEHELVCSTIITSFGFALHLALAGEPILLELQRTVDRVTAKAARLEAWLLDQGWTAIATD